MADADPPNESDDGEAPADGDIDAPDAHTFDEQVANGEIQEHQQRKRNGESENPALGRAATQHDRADLVSYRAQRITRLNNRMSRCRFDGALRAFRVHAVASEHRIDACELKEGATKLRNRRLLDPRTQAIYG